MNILCLIRSSGSLKMNPKKNGMVFIVLMIALVAYGFGSVANALDVDGNMIVNLVPSNFSSFNQQQITQIDNPFKPVYLINHIVINSSNTTNITDDYDNQTNQDAIG